MDDLISRQALLKSIERISIKGNVLDDDWIYRFIQEFPSAQPERLVLCKDCRWRTDLEHTAWHPCDAMAVNDKWYCAYGERRKDDEELRKL